ncbi:MAG: PaaI family thioesterase [Pseudomonadota bacterium]
MTPLTEQKIRDSFARQSLMHTLGARISAIAAGCVEITADIRPGLLQQQGFAHAGLTFAIGDSAAGYSALSLLGLESEVLTTEMKINLLAPAQGTCLIARGRVVKPGQRLIVVEADVHARDDAARETHIARLIGTMMPVALS